MKSVLFRFPAAAAVAACSVHALAQPEPEPEYRAQLLGLLPNAFSNVPWALNNAGHVVGWNQGPQAIVRAYIWTPESGLVELMPPGFEYSYATDISDTGWVVGIAYVGITGANTERAWRWRAGVFEFLPPIAGGCSGMRPTGVNDRGDVVGNSCPDGGTPGPRAWIYTDATGTVDLTPVGILDARDINNAGVVTGRSLAGPAYRWSAAAGLELLPTLPAPYDDYAAGEGLNERNEVVGLSANAVPGTDLWRAFFLAGGGPPVMISNPVTARSTAYAVNESSVVVGADGTTSTTNISGWVWDPQRGKRFILAVLDDGTEITMSRPIDVNDRGQITGNSNTVPVGAAMLTPLAAPACAADFNGDGAAGVQDIYDFLTAWSASDPRADFNDSPGVTVQDIYDFLAAWSAGCP